MNVWQYTVATDLQQTLAQRWASAGREPDVLCYGLRSAGAVAMRTMLATYFRLRIHGRERLPRDGSSFVIVANHASHLDALCLLSALPISRLHHAYPAAAADYFFQSPAAGALSGLFMNALPFERNGRVRRTLAACRNLLAEDGNILLLFPEGTRSTTGQIGRFKGGVGELVAGTSVPVVPCYLDGAHRAWPKGAWIPRPRKLTLAIGQPMAFAHLQRCRQSATQIAAELEAAVRDLSKQSKAGQRSIHDERDTRNHNDALPARGGFRVAATAAAAARVAAC
jgi:1-acyl-sn-glycerol-3-phosphate acyltransferase